MRSLFRFTLFLLTSLFLLPRCASAEDLTEKYFYPLKFDNPSIYLVDKKMMSSLIIVAKEGNPNSICSLPFIFFSDPNPGVQNFKKAYFWKRVCNAFTPPIIRSQVDIVGENLTPPEKRVTLENMAKHLSDEERKIVDVDAAEWLKEHQTQLEKYAAKNVALVRHYADRGCPRQQFLLALYYERGYGVPQDNKEVVKLLKAASDQDYNDATAKLLVSYQHKDLGLKQNNEEVCFLTRLAPDCDKKSGTPLTEDQKERIKKKLLNWREQRALNSDYAAASFLARAYTYGWYDFPQDYNEAAKWYKIALNQGIRDSTDSTELGRLYMNGYGVPKDKAEAYFWLSLYGTDANGQSTTVNALKSGLTDEQLKDIRTRQKLLLMQQYAREKEIARYCPLDP